jgi:hypothetical protein
MSAGDGAFLGVVFTIMLVLACTFFNGIGYDSGIARVRSDAIDAGVAEYVTDSSTGQTRFTFINPED